MRSLRLLQADTPRNCHVRLGRNLSRKPPTDSTAHGSLPSRVTRKANCKRNLINHAKQITMEQSESDALLVIALQLAGVLAVNNAARIEHGVDRLARDAHVQAHEFAVGVEAGGQLALRDRPVEVARLVLLAAPDQLDRDVGEFLGDLYRLMDIVLRAAAPAEAAAEVVPIDFTFRERNAGGLRQGCQ